MLTVQILERSYLLQEMWNYAYESYFILNHIMDYVFIIQVLLLLLPALVYSFTSLAVTCKFEPPSLTKLHIFRSTTAASIKESKCHVIITENVRRSDQVYYLWNKCAKNATTALSYEYKRNNHFTVNSKRQQISDLFRQLSKQCLDSLPQIEDKTLLKRQKRQGSLLIYSGE